ncbi:Insulinase (Peptidase M16) [Podila verticillata]|nr:Insulinase (Peptidase M16) [Podila verticillata]
MDALPDGFQYADDGSHAFFTQPIERSLNDKREYRLVQLNNQLQVLLIHDAEADKSAAAMDVHVGHLSDPDNLQGLAHFLEHLLFLGTEKYPRENAYKEYLAQHSGKSNATTSLDNTTYHFEVGHEYLEGALDRFAQFFIAPLFNADCKEREIRAVDSEFKRNLQQDSRRQFQLGKTLSSPQHPYWHFSTGNLTTLEEEPTKAGIDVRSELIQFHAKYSSASIMRLAILGREPLDELVQWVVEKFSAVRNLGITPPAYPHGPLTANELLRTTFVKPVKNLRSLVITFPYPDQTAHYTVQPARYIGHLIGHEGAGSILSLLKRKGWADKLSTGNSSGGIGFEFLKIVIDLTPEGLARYEEVVLVVFQYIMMIRQQGLQTYIWDEISSLSSIAFRFKEKSPASNYVTSLVRIMQRGYAPEWVISGAELIREYNPGLIQASMDVLEVDRWHCTVVAQDVAVVPGGTFTCKERWYGTEYHVAPVSASLLDKLRNLSPHAELHLPGPNDYIPRNFDTHKLPVVTPLKAPTLLKHTPLTRLWHKKDDIFWVPKVNLYFQLTTPLVLASPATFVRSVMFVKLVKDSLTEEAYSAELAGLKYALDVTVEGIVLKIEGFNDKALILLQTVVERIKHLQVDLQRFSVLLDQLERQYANFAIEEPNRLAMYVMSQLLQEKQWSYSEKLEELQGLTAHDIQAFQPWLLSRLQIEGLVHGNMGEEQALEACAMVETILAPTRPLTATELLPARSVLLPQARCVHEQEVPNATNVNSAIEYYFQVDYHDGSKVFFEQEGEELAWRRERSALTQIVAQILQEPCFNQLRTKEQLGYIVHCTTRTNAGSTGLRIVVQSERDPRFLQSRIEDFLVTRIGTMFREMTEAEFAKHVRSLVNKKLETDKMLKEETTRYWEQISSKVYDFAQIPQEVAAMQAVTLSDVKVFYQIWMHPASVACRSLQVHMRSQALGPYSEMEEVDQTKSRRSPPIVDVVVKDIVQFKAGLTLSKAPLPVDILSRHDAPSISIRSTL